MPSETVFYCQTHNTAQFSWGFFGRGWEGWDKNYLLGATKSFNFWAERVKSRKHTYKEKASLQAEDSIAPGL